MHYSRIALVILLSLLVFTPAFAQEEDDALIVTTGEERAIPPDMFGLNANVTGFDQPWTNENLLEAFGKTQVSTLRYPAGTLGNYWDWEIGWLGQDIEFEGMLPEWNTWIPNTQASENRYPLENLAVVYEEYQPTIIFMVNMVTRDLDHALEGLRRAEELGIPIERVELGNELWINVFGHYTEAFPTPASYAEAANEWAAAIKAEWPDVQIAAVGGDVIPRITNDLAGRDRRVDWNAEVLPVFSEDIDAVTYHSYPRTILVPSGGRFGSPENQAAQYAALGTEEGVALLLGQPYADYTETHQLSALEDSEASLWVTEWNMADGTGTVHDSWAHALFTANFIDAMLADDRVQLIIGHNLMSRYGAVYTPGDGSLGGLQLEGIDTESLVESIEPFSLTPFGHALAVFGEAADGMTSATSLQFEDSPQILTEVDDTTTVLLSDAITYSGVWGWSFSDGDAQNIVVANMTAEPQTIDVSALDVADSAYEQMSAAPTTYITNDETIDITTGTVGEILMLPPYSLTSIQSNVQ